LITDEQIGGEKSISKSEYFYPKMVKTLGPFKLEV